MRVGPYLEKLDQALWLTRILQLTVLLLAVLALLLARQSTILHIAPPDFQREYTVRKTSASRDYIEQMAIFLLVNGLTVNPDSAIYSTKSFLRWLTPEARGKLETALLGDAEWIKSNQVSQAFYPRACDFFGPLKLRVTGTLLQWTGGRLITSRDVAIDLRVAIDHYTLKIEDMAYVDTDRTHNRPSRAPAPAATE